MKAEARAPGVSAVGGLAGEDGGEVVIIIVFLGEKRIGGSGRCCGIYL